MDRASYNRGYKDGYKKAKAEFSGKNPLDNLMDRAYRSAVKRGKLSPSLYGESMAISARRQIKAVKKELIELYKALFSADISNHTPKLTNVQEEAADVLISALTLCRLTYTSAENVETKMDFNDIRPD